MDVFYAEQNEQKGPISIEAFHRKVEQGELSQDTLVFTEGMSDWLAFSDAAQKGLVPPLPAAPAAPATGGLRLATQPGSGDTGTSGEPLVGCPTCGQRVSASELIPFENRKVCPHCRDRVLQQVKEGVGISTPNVLRYAGFGPRLGSYVIDYIIMQAYSQILGFAFGFTNAMNFEGDDYDATAMMGLILYMLLSFLGSYFYYIYMMGSPKHQATLGMKALKLKVVRSDGTPITKWRAFGRQLATMISGLLLGIGYLMVLWDPEKATLHDKIADTRIVFK